ncbi:MAG: hypothetical protein O4753_13215 [Trichodesmium sp. St7_bin2_1]|nr:hypothetical protein [Trichodesmium sp. St7_bin2_1]
MRNKGKALGNNPLSEGVFTKTKDSRVNTQDSRFNQVSQQTQHSEILGQDSQFLSRRQEDLRGTGSGVQVVIFAVRLLTVKGVYL